MTWIIRLKAQNQEKSQSSIPNKSNLMLNDEINKIFKSKKIIKLKQIKKIRTGFDIQIKLNDGDEINKNKFNCFFLIAIKNRHQIWHMKKK